MNFIELHCSSFPRSFAAVRRAACTLVLALALQSVAAQVMSDTQVARFVQSEMRAGTAQSQIVTKLMQRGVKIDQIRRVRTQYEAQLRTGTSIGGDDPVQERLRANNDGTTEQETNTARPGSNNTDASTEHDKAEGDVQATQDTPGDAANKRVFGRDIFSRRTLSFEPNMNIPTPQNYVLGPGDQLVIDIYGASQKTLQLSVSPEGTITVPGYGPITVNGMTVSSAARKIRSTVGSRYQSSDIRVTVGQTRTIMINIMGEVRTPGTYRLSAFSSVFHALYMAGGINQLGTLRNVQVFRGGRLVTTVDIYEYILNGKLEGDIRLEEGDVIQVGPYDCLVGITGNVKRPMFYEMRRTETVATLLKYAGGFTGDAFQKSVRLERKTGSRYQVYNIDEFDFSSFKLEDGDALSIDGIINRYENKVEIKGAVFRPGVYQLGTGVNSVRSLIETAEGVTEDAFTAHGVIHRLNEDRTLRTIPVDVAGILAGTVPDIPLANEDILFIPTIVEAQQQRILTVHGEVIHPGDYEFADNTTLEDLIMLAGGLTDAASTVKVDVSRRILDSKSTSTTRELAETFTFALKDGFVIDGQPGFLLKPYDIVYVRRSPGFQTPRNIRVQGEVAFSGVYTMHKKNMRLSEAIAAAGGVTDEAYVKGARLERTMNVDERARRDFLLQQLASQSNDKDSIDIAKLQLATTYTVGIYLEKALAKPGSDFDIVLREGDRIVVPEYNGTVKVSGDVMYPNTVAYLKGKGYKWYVNQSGGFGTKAKKRKTWIIYQNGTMSMANKHAKIEPGCEIIVPTKPKKNTPSFNQWGSMGVSVASIAAMIATIVSVSK